MTALAKSGAPSPCTVLPDAGERVGTFQAAAAIAAGDACRIATDKTVVLSTGAANTTAAAVHGFAGQDAMVGEVVTLWANINFGYGTAATVVPGKPYYLSGTVPGGLDDATSTGGTVPAALGLPDGRIRVLQVIK